MSDAVGQVIGSYRIEAPLGIGGMGQVFRARHLHLDRLAALKLMHAHLANDPSFQTRFLVEARAIAALHHPHIVEVYDFAEHQGRAYLVMEYVAGGSLRALLQHQSATGQGWTLAQGLDLVRQAAQGLAHAHAVGMVHRDIKPDNLLLDAAAPGQPLTLKIGDFGLARLGESANLTGTGKAIGTPAYMAPEQCQGRPVDGRCDLYSLGIVLYELATGHLPFQIKSITEAVYKHIFEPPPPPRELHPNLPPALEAIILRCLAKRPDDRFANAEALIAALSQVQGGDLASLASQVVPVSVPAFSTGSILGTMERGYSGNTVPPPAPTPLPAVSLPQVRVLDAQGRTLQVVELRGAGLSVGRVGSNQLALDADGVSRHHLNLAYDGQQVSVTDLGSSNGTLLGDERLVPQLARQWPWRTLLRVGPFWLQLEPPAAPPNNTPPTNSPPSVAVLPIGGVTGLSDMNTSGLIQTNRLMLRLDSDTLTLTPGQATPLQLTLSNLGATVDHLALSVSGVPESWVSGTGGVVQLNPGSQAHARLTVLVPASAESAAGDYAVKVRARSRGWPAEGAQAEGRWTVLPFQQTTLALGPTRATGRSQAGYHVTLQNDGNAPARYRLAGEDEADALGYSFTPDELTVEAGGADTARLVVTRAGRLVGRPEAHGFVVRATGSEGAPRLEGRAQFVQPALLPPWAVGLLLLLVLLLGGAALLANPASGGAAPTQSVASNDAAAALALAQTSTAQSMLLSTATANAADNTPVAMPSPLAAQPSPLPSLSVLPTTAQSPTSNIDQSGTSVVGTVAPVDTAAQLTREAGLTPTAGAQTATAIAQPTSPSVLPTPSPGTPSVPTLQSPTTNSGTAEAAQTEANSTSVAGTVAPVDTAEQQTRVARLTATSVAQTASAVNETSTWAAQTTTAAAVSVANTVIAQTASAVNETSTWAAQTTTAAAVSVANTVIAQTASAVNATNTSVAQTATAAAVNATNTSVALTAVAAPSTANLAPENADLNFPATVITATTYIKKIKLTNTGATNLKITTIDLTDPVDFGSKPSDTVDKLCTANMTLVAGDACFIKVFFQPQSKGNHSTDLVVTTNASNSPHTITLTGKGI